MNINSKHFILRACGTWLPSTLRNTHHLLSEAENGKKGFGERTVSPNEERDKNIHSITIGANVFLQNKVPSAHNPAWPPSKKGFYANTL